jgi:cytochrome c biogenesis protein CcmG/thiol:disulfide interchange protein DsbE
MSNAATSVRQAVRERLGPHGVFWISGGVVAILVTGFIWLLFQPSNQAGSPNALAIGHAAPNFSLRDTAGHGVRLAQYQGHPVIVNFWGTFCSPCQSETPLLQRTYTAHTAQGLVILGIDQGEDAGAVTQFGKNYGLTYPLLTDIDLAANHQYGVTALPVTYFVDAHGVIRYTSNGPLTTATMAAGLQSIGLG